MEVLNMTATELDCELDKLDRDIAIRERDRFMASLEPHTAP